MLMLGALMFLTAALPAESQPRSSAGGERVPIRVQSGSNELYAVHEAPVAYARLTELVEDIARPAEPGGGPIRVTRASPRQIVDYQLCVTREGTLVVGARLHTFDPGERRYVFTRGELDRSYRPIPTPEGWLWLVEAPVSREVTVVLELRAPASWPVESVSVTAGQVP